MGLRPRSAPGDRRRPRPARRRGGPAGLRRAARRTRRSGRRCTGRRPAAARTTRWCCRAGTGPAACATISRASRSSRWRSTRSGPTSRSARSATASWWRRGRSTRRRGAPCCTAGARPRSPGRWSARPGASPLYTRFWDANYYRTYIEEPGQPCGLHVGAAGGDAGAGRPVRLRGRGRATRPTTGARRAGGPGTRSTDDRGRPGSCATARYVSARWPGDVHTFARRSPRFWRVS